VKFEGIDTPEDAALIHGHTILIPPSDREPLDDEDEFYVQELVGLHVHLESSGEMVGTVVDIFDGTGTHDVLRIKMPDAVSSTSDDEEEGGENAGPRYFMLPFAKQFVPVVDVGANVMRIMPPEGLLELAAPVTQKKERKESAGKREKRRPKKPSQGRSEGGFFSSEGSE